MATVCIQIQISHAILLLFRLLPLLEGEWIKVSEFSIRFGNLKGIVLKCATVSQSQGETEGFYGPQKKTIYTSLT
jgi:hypothetical protein